MQTITFNDTNLSALVFDDDVDITYETIKKGGPEEAFVNRNNSTIHSNVTLPDDWKTNNYQFDGTNWTFNEEVV